MKKLIAAAAILWLGAAAGAAGPEVKTLEGFVSDSLCGASHKAMAEKQGSKISDRDCVIACLNYSTADSPKLVFVVKGTIYKIANQKFPGLIRHAGETIHLTGDVEGTTITVTKLEAAK